MERKEEIRENQFPFLAFQLYDQFFKNTICEVNCINRNSETPLLFPTHPVRLMIVCFVTDIPE